MSQFLVLFLIGIVAWGVAALLLSLGRRSQAKANLAGRIVTSTAAETSSLISGEMVELKGTVRCDTPLTGELSQRQCVYYASEVVREYEERRQNSKGEWETHRRSETVASNKQMTPFMVEDATGRVTVRPDGAEIDAQKVVDRFEQPNQAMGPSISFGGIALNLGGGGGTVGYRYRESIIPVDAPVYILGVFQESGEVGRPPEGSKQSRFVISHRSEEELRRSWRSSARWLAGGAIATFVVGAILVIVAFITLIV